MGYLNPQLFTSDTAILPSILIGVIIVLTKCQAGVYFKNRGAGYMHTLTKRNIYSQSGKFARNCFLLFSLLVFCCYAPATVWAESADDPAQISQLDKIENKLFQHNYAKDATDARISRLEQTVFGENKKGSNDERVAALVKAVPNLDNAPADSAANNNSVASDNPSNSEATGKAPAKSREVAKDDADNGDLPGNYPAITAMEAKLLGKDYSAEPVKDRLARLEKKTLGAVSTSSDLSERVDKLKEATGIDVARKPNLSDWLEEDDDTVAHGAPPSSRGGNLGFGNQDVYQDMQKSHSIKNPYSSAYVPDQANRNAGISIKSFGLSQQVLALEHEIFAKGFEHDPLPARLNRLEASVFPGQKPNTDMALPQRVQILIAKVPIPQQELQSLAENYQIDPGTSMATDSFGNNNTAPRSHKNLNKIINSLGNMLSGGMAGGYPMSGGNYVLDPTTGMLIDPNTGYMINPNSGTMYNGRPNYNSSGSGNYGYNSFGASPFGGPGLGMGSGIGPGFGSGFGFGGGGMSFGFR